MYFLYSETHFIKAALSTWMKFLDNLPQVVAIQVRVDLRCGDGFVTEHFLHRAQIGAAFNEVRSKRVTKSVRADRLVQADVEREILDDGEDHNPRELLSISIQEHKALMPLLRRLVRRTSANFLHIELCILQRIATDRHEALLIALARNAEKAHIGVNVVQLEVNKLADTKTGTIQHFQHRAVAASFGFGLVDGLQELFDLGIAQRVGKFATQFGSLQQGRGIFFDERLKEQVFKKSFETREDARLAMGAHAQLINVLEELLTLPGGDRKRRRVGMLHAHKLLEQRHVVEIGLDGVRRQGTLEFEIVVEMLGVKVPVHFAKLSALSAEAFANVDFLFRLGPVTFLLNLTA